MSEHSSNLPDFNTLQDGDEITVTYRISWDRSLIRCYPIGEDIFRLLVAIGAVAGAIAFIVYGWRNQYPKACWHGISALFALNYLRSEP